MGSLTRHAKHMRSQHDVGIVHVSVVIVFAKSHNTDAPAET